MPTRVSIEMTRQNNNRLGQSVERTLALGSNVVMVGLAIQSALTRQKRVLEATQRTREFLGNLIVANAASIKQHTQDIGDVYNNPVIAIDKITQAHNDLIEAMNTADRLKQEGIDKARENIAKLSQLSSDLQERSQGLREQRGDCGVTDHRHDLRPAQQLRDLVHHVAHVGKGLDVVLDKAACVRNANFAAKALRTIPGNIRMAWAKINGMTPE